MNTLDLKKLAIAMERRINDPHVSARMQRRLLGLMAELLDAIEGREISDALVSGTVAQATELLETLDFQ